MSHTPPHIADAGLNGVKRAKYSPNVHGSEVIYSEARNMEPGSKKYELVPLIEEKWKPKIAELDNVLSNVVGLHGLKQEVTSWVKGVMLDEKRRALGLNVSAERQRTPHMMFLGNTGTGKTMVARILGRLLHNVGILPTDKVIEVQPTDLVAKDSWSTHLTTTKKIQEAKGGILFVEKTYRLKSATYGLEALKEIISAMHNREVVVIFADTRFRMEMISSSEGFLRRAGKQFVFGDLSSAELAQIVRVKMGNQAKDSALFGYRLHPSCTEEAIAKLIENGTTRDQRCAENGHLVDNLLNNARNSLNGRLDFYTNEEDELATLTLDDLEGGIRSLNKY